MIEIPPLFQVSWPTYLPVLHSAHLHVLSIQGLEGHKLMIDKRWWWKNMTHCFSQVWFYWSSRVDEDILCSVCWHTWVGGRWLTVWTDGIDGNVHVWSESPLCRPGLPGAPLPARAILSMGGLSHGVIRVNTEDKNSALTVQDVGHVMPGGEYRRKDKWVKRMKKKKRLIGVCWKILHPRFESRLLKVTHELWCCEFRSSKRNVDVMKNSIWNLQFGKNSVKQPNYQILDFRIFHKRLNCMFSQLYQRKMMSWFSCVVCFRKHLVTNIKCTFMSLCASSSDVHC